MGWNANKLTLGKLSGRNAFRTRLKELGIELDSEDLLNAAFARFKDLADKKSEIFDEDLHALVSDEFISEATEHYKLVYLQVASITGEVPHAITKKYYEFLLNNANLALTKSQVSLIIASL